MQANYAQAAWPGGFSGTLQGGIIPVFTPVVMQ
jgi:hypothetical protein